MREDDCPDAKGAALALHVLQPHPLHQLELGLGLVLGISGSGAGSAAGERARSITGNAPATQSSRQRLLLGYLGAARLGGVLVVLLAALLLSHAGNPPVESSTSRHRLLLLGGGGVLGLPGSAELLRNQHGRDDDGEEPDADLGQEPAGDRARRFGDQFLPEGRRRIGRHLRAPSP